MKSLEELKMQLSSHRDELRQRYRVKEMGLFGSFTRGEANENSDLDILVELEEPIGLFRFQELEEYLSGFLGVKVDLVSRKALKPNIGKQVLDEVVRI